ncbi:hypothetical protein WMF26_40210 [Sorangium sp. So ce185]|uniref:hypothetical protein n=1 Tax=Sorangium sp. So ce185 TaxID=3133287 RepID=UPI003F60EC1B
MHALSSSCQFPDASQLCGCWPLHRLSPGPQTPVHRPATQVWSLEHSPSLDLQAHASSDVHVHLP